MPISLITIPVSLCIKYLAAVQRKPQEAPLPSEVLWRDNNIKEIEGSRELDLG
jgi:hypothetical protein